MEQLLVYLFSALVGLIVLILGGIVVIPVVDAIRISYTRHPSRFKRVDRLDLFQREKLPEIAKSIGMEVNDEVSSHLQQAIEATWGSLGIGRVSDVLTKSYSQGKLVLVNYSEKSFKEETLARWQYIAMDQDRRIYLPDFHGRDGDRISPPSSHPQ